MGHHLDQCHRYVEEINKQRTGNYDEVNIESCDPKMLKGQQTKSKQKRKRRPTPVTSPRLQEAKTIKRVRRESSTKLTTFADGTVSLKSFLALKVGQLRRLSEGLKLPQIADNNTYAIGLKEKP